MAKRNVVPKVVVASAALWPIANVEPPERKSDGFQEYQEAEDHPFADEIIAKISVNSLEAVNLMTVYSTS